MALWDGRAVKEYQKPRFRPRPWGSIHHRLILTTIRSSFSKDDTYIYKLFKPLSFFGRSETQGFCLIHNSWFITVFCESVNWLASLSVLSVSVLDRMRRYTLILIRADCLCINVSSRLSFLFCFFIPDPAVKTWGIWQEKVSKLPRHQITIAVTSSHLISELRCTTTFSIVFI